MSRRATIRWGVVSGRGKYGLGSGGVWGRWPGGGLARGDDAVARAAAAVPVVMSR